MPLRIALLEIDHWHVPMYLEALRGLDARIVGVSDRDLPKARRAAEHIGCAAYPSAAELLDREAVDFAFAFAPHWRMFLLASLLVERGQPFAMEKPMALRAADLAALVPRIESSGMFAGVAFVRRLGGFGRALLERRGELGAVHHFQSRFIGGPMQRYADAGCDWMLDKEHAGGGCMMNFGTHFFDLFLSLVQEPVRRAFCQTSRRLHGASVEDLASVLLETDSGALATLESGYLLPSEPKEDILSLSAAEAYAGNDARRWRHPTICYRSGKTLHVLDEEPTYGDYVADTLRRFRAGEAPLADVRAMVRVLECINAAYASAGSGEPVAPQRAL
jgi:predicted dehydrogenase